MRTNAEPRSAAPMPAPKPKVAPETQSPSAVAAPAPAAGGGAVKQPTPSATQAAGSRFRAPEGPTMAPRGTPGTTRRLDTTP